MMPYWHVSGKQNLANEAYRSTPERFTAKTQEMRPRVIATIPMRT